MNDRLEDLMKCAQRNLEIQQVEENTQCEADPDLMEYVAQVMILQNYTNDIKQFMLRLEQVIQEINLTIGSKAIEICKEVDNIMEKMLLCQGKGNAVLKILNDKLTKAKKDDPEGANSETRIKINLYGANSKIFGEAISSFEDIQCDLKLKMQEKILRDAEIILNRKIDPSERQMILEDQFYVQKILSDKLTGTGHIKLQNVVNDIEDRYKDIIKLENSVNQVHKLFVEMAILVKTQGELIDNIEENVKISKGHVLEAEKNIVKSKVNMMSARKKKCIILIIVAVILLVIILPILGVKYF